MRNDNSQNMTSKELDAQPIKVAVCFADPNITALFAELLSSHGAKVNALLNLDQLTDNCRVVTEAQFFPQLDRRFWDRCLIVGNRNSLQGIDVLSLSQPLTEDKIESAFSQLLSSPIKSQT